MACALEGEWRRGDRLPPIGEEEEEGESWRKDPLPPTTVRSEGRVRFDA